MMNDVMRRIAEIGIVPVIRIDDVEKRRALPRRCARRRPRR